MCNYWQVASMVEDKPLLDALAALSRALVAITTKSLSALGEEVTLTQYRTLVVLASRGPQRAAELAAELEVTPSTVTRLCDRLVQRGWARRQPGETDRRHVLIVLTGEGKRLVGQAMHKRRDLLSALIESVPPGQAATAAKAMTRLAQAAGEAPDALWWEHWARSAPD
jgi:DNA-binding MarR family transcriptional regulator